MILVIDSKSKKKKYYKMLRNIYLISARVDETYIDGFISTIPETHAVQ